MIRITMTVNAEIVEWLIPGSSQTLIRELMAFLEEAKE